MSDKSKLRLISNVIKTAENWIAHQDAPEMMIIMSALKDIRRIVKE